MLFSDNGSTSHGYEGVLFRKLNILKSLRFPNHIYTVTCSYQVLSMAVFVLIMMALLSAPSQARTDPFSKERSMLFVSRVFQSPKVVAHAVESKEKGVDGS